MATEKELLTAIQVLTDRLSDLELAFESFVKEKKGPKSARTWTVWLFGVALALTIAPQNLKAGDFSYQTGGIPIETWKEIAALVASIKAIEWGYKGVMLRMHENNPSPPKN